MAPSSTDNTTSSHINAIKEKLDTTFNAGESHVEAGINHLMEGRTVLAKDRITKGLRLLKATRLSVDTKLNHLQTVIGQIKHNHVDEVKSLKRELMVQENTVKRLKKSSEELKITHTEMNS